jgi:glycosyltransferase involved in cell wall biosynthesis
MSQVEINIVPLQDNGFTNSKSELKYFEAAAAGTLTIATPIFSYANAIEDGVNGFLATSTEWETKILEVVDRLNSYEELAHSAHEHSVTNYGWFNQLDCIESAVFGRAWQSSF